jgi:hypothetical protein
MDQSLSDAFGITPPLELAAQAVLDAAMQYEINPECYSREIAAAALRAAADQVAPLSTNRRQNDIRFGLLRIADELAAQ